ncbi:hypothetical protein [Methylobacterium sp. WCS2018Hpa-22]|uniref:hypothetical protein n=1 Tax=Methylobacterium sp. WCS2018Hpa-22 TaxID=3073633 RepID=UPI00288960BC|nr:hypothetical protein [Methylobacterium sp. WCS2018Hpa-22]
MSFTNATLTERMASLLAGRGVDLDRIDHVICALIEARFSSREVTPCLDAAVSMAKGLLASSGTAA